jgi:hypothetical protein
MTTAADGQDLIKLAIIVLLFYVPFFLLDHWLYKRSREADDDELEADAASVPDDQEKTTSV